MLISYQTLGESTCSNKRAGSPMRFFFSLSHNVVIHLLHLSEPVESVE